MKTIFTIRAGKLLAVGMLLQLAMVALSAQSTFNLGALPLWFEADRNAPVVSTQFIAHGRDSEIVIAPDAVQFAFQQSGGQTVVARMSFAGANPAAAVSGEAEMTGKINYLIGNDASRWQTGVPMYGQVRVDNLYPGVDLVYYGNQKSLEYDYQLASSVRPETITLRFSGTENISLNEQGELLIQLAGGKVVEHQPIAYQIARGGRHEIQAGYKMLDAHTVTFVVGAYDHTLPLVIDPVLSFSTYFGGNNITIPWAIALNTNDGSVYIAGQTMATALVNGKPFSTTAAYRTNFQGGINGGDVFVAKFDNNGTNLLYCTYLGGSANDLGYALAVDPDGNAFVAGQTDSTNFPVTNAIVSGTFNGSKFPAPFDNYLRGYPFEAFVTELNAGGNQLIYSTYLGGNEANVIYGMALDTFDDVFVTGVTYATNFPVTAYAYQKTPAFYNSLYYNGNVFVSEIASNGNTLKYSTYFGGTNLECAFGIACNSNYVAIAGLTGSTNFPTTNYIYQPYLQTPYIQTNIIGINHIVGTNFYNGSLLNGATSNNFASSYDAFVTEFAVVGTNLSLRYSTLLGGTNTDEAFGVALDAAGNTYVVGWTTSTNYPSTTNANMVNMGSFISTNAYNAFATNAFLTKVGYGTNAWNSTNATAYIDFSQTFGGPGIDAAGGVTLDAAGNVFVIGSATTTNIPTTNYMGSLAATNAGYSDVFVTVFKSDFSTLLFSAFLGGENNDYGHGIAVDAADNIYLTGQTFSTYFPTFNACQTNLNNIISGFLAKVILTNSLPTLDARLSGTNVQVSWAPIPYEQTTSNSLSLESITNLLSTNWVPVVQAPVFTNGSYVYTIGRGTNPTSFFRFQQN